MLNGCDSPSILCPGAKTLQGFYGSLCKPVGERAPGMCGGPGEPLTQLEGGHPERPVGAEGEGGGGADALSWAVMDE